MFKFDYYCSYLHHRDDFDAGVPVLMYHKLGPAPRGAPGGVMYVDAPLFRRHLRELREAGFRTATLGDLPETPGNPGRRFALSFDDGYANASREALAPLAEAGYTAIQFLVSGLLGGRNEWDLPLGVPTERLMDAGQVREWLAAGHEIGSHTVSHPHLCRISPARAREEIEASKKALEDTFGLPVPHFCYPYGEYDESVRDLVAEAGYATASTTRPGVNAPDIPRHELRRLMACAPIRTPRQALLRLLDRARRALTPPL